MEIKRVAVSAVIVLAALAACSTPASAAPIIWNLAGGAGQGPQGNSYSFSQSGITLNVTGWGYTYSSSNNALEKAALGQWSAGVGVCNAAEGFSCGSPAHQADNNSDDDWVLFLFSVPVDPVSVLIDPYGTYDRDVRYYVGNVSTPLDLTGKTYANLAALGFSSPFDDLSTTSSSARSVSIAGGAGNALLFGPLTGGEGDGADYFKLVSVTTAESVPEPGSMILLGSGLLGLARYARRRK